MLSFPLVAEALTGLIYLRPSGETFLFRMEMTCFNVVFDVVKFQDVSTTYFQVRFFHA